MKASKTNVIMICLDGARVDYIDKSNDLKDLFIRGTFFENSIVSSPYTVASIHSIMTGMYGYLNGVNAYNNMFKLRDNLKFLPEYLNEEGYHTTADVLGEAVISKRGFDDFTVHEENRLSSKQLMLHHQEIIKKANNTNKPFFTFLQYSKIHAGCVENIAKKFDDLDESYYSDNQKNKNRDKFVEYMQDAGKYSKGIVDYLTNLEILDNTLIIFFSDHGTSLGEKVGEKMYGSFVYDYTIKTFFHFYNPSFPIRRIKTQIRCIDIFPTILEFLKIIPDPSRLNYQGESLFPIINYSRKNLISKFFSSKPEDRIAYVETGGLGGHWPSPAAPNVKCIRTERWKIIHNLTPDTWELYDILEDPSEKDNLVFSRKDIFFKLKKFLRTFEKRSDKAKKI